MAQAQRYLLTRVAHLHHIADLAYHFQLVFPASFFQKTFERRGRIEVVFDGILAFAGDDNDVFDPGSDALFGHVLNLRLVHDGEHFFRLRLGGGQEARAESCGREHRLANFVAASRGTIRLRSVGCGGGGVGHGLSFSHTPRG